MLPGRLVPSEARRAYRLDRLSSILATDGFLPRQLAALGDRLAYNNGIIVLALLAIVVLVPFHGESQALLPLYTVGVFIAFTSAQAGMVRKSWNQSKRPWASLLINGIGAVLTFVVLCVVALLLYLRRSST